MGIAVRILFAAGLGLLVPTALAAQRFEPVALNGLRWFKGNTHTHTTGSDGDSSPEVVATWYKSHGYQFLVLSDHNVFTDPAALSGLVDSTFLLIGGEEVTSQFQRRPVHVNGLALSRLVAPRTINLDGIFGHLANVAWTSAGPCPPARVPRSTGRWHGWSSGSASTGCRARSTGSSTGCCHPRSPP